MRQPAYRASLRSFSDGPSVLMRPTLHRTSEWLDLCAFVPPIFSGACSSFFISAGLLRQPRACVRAPCIFCCTFCKEPGGLTYRDFLSVFIPLVLIRAKGSSYHPRRRFFPAYTIMCSGAVVVAGAPGRCLRHRLERSMGGSTGIRPGWIRPSCESSLRTAIITGTAS